MIKIRPVNQQKVQNILKFLELYNIEALELKAISPFSENEHQIMQNIVQTSKLDLNFFPRCLQLHEIIKLGEISPNIKKLKIYNDSIVSLYRSRLLTCIYEFPNLTQITFELQEIQDYAYSSIPPSIR